MSLSISFSGAEDGSDGPFDLGSAKDWKAFSDWVKSLPDLGFDRLKSLADDGETKGTDVLSEQLQAAIMEHSPLSPAKEVADQLLENIGAGDSDETATVFGG